MKTTIVPINDSKAIEYAKSLLAQEQVIAGPTDTVFGVMCRYDSVEALTRLYEAKKRPPQKAIPVLLGSPSQLPQIAQLPIDPRAYILMEKFWPGPLTIILPAQPTLPKMLTAGQTTVAVRIPEHEPLRRLLNVHGPLAVTSANLSDHRETSSAAEVNAQLGGRIPLILDDSQNGETKNTVQQKPKGVASTIIDLSSFDATSNATISTTAISNTTSTTISSSTTSTQKVDYKFLRAGPIEEEVKQTLDEIARNGAPDLAATTSK